MYMSINQKWQINQLEPFKTPWYLVAIVAKKNQHNKSLEVVMLWNCVIGSPSNIGTTISKVMAS